MITTFGESLLSLLVSLDVAFSSTGGIIKHNVAVVVFIFST
jgi:hypothetical protein